jgi:hypothetical protein
MHHFSSIRHELMRSSSLQQLLTLRLKDLLKKETSLSNVVLNTILVDNYLWDYRQDHDKETSVVPFHRIRCIYY